jgi:ElaB/YqjD/DUF883 family membrane-anchored ribosome-binding protein
MTSNRPDERDLSADFSALRDDIAKLSSTVSNFIRGHTNVAPNSLYDSADSARQKISDTAGKAQDRMTSASKDFERTIEHYPYTALLAAMASGFVVGLVTRGLK